MPYYKPLKKMSSQDRIRTVDGINRLREQFAAMNFPQKNSHSTLILGTWNIRNFDDDRFNYGPRTKEALYYIAEIISRFDIIAVQEICVNLRPLKQLLYILGDNYDFIVSDETHSSLGGNQERLGFIYDKNKVDFKSVVGEIVLPPKMELSKVYKEKRQFARTPYGAEFQSEWFKFFFSTVHIYFGSNSPNSDKYKRRVKEIQAVAKYLADQSEKSRIVRGDEAERPRHVRAGLARRHGNKSSGFGHAFGASAVRLSGEWGRQGLEGNPERFREGIHNGSADDDGTEFGVGRVSKFLDSFGHPLGTQRVHIHGDLEHEFNGPSGENLRHRGRFIPLPRGKASLTPSFPGQACRLNALGSRPPRTRRGDPAPGRAVCVRDCLGHRVGRGGIAKGVHAKILAQVFPQSPRSSPAFPSPSPAPGRRSRRRSR